MSYELTTEGLFSYFDPDTIKELIELPLIKRHLSTHDYYRCKEILANPQQRLQLPPPKSIHIKYAILGEHILKSSSLDEVKKYLDRAEIKKVYSSYYGQYFSLFYQKISAMQEGLQSDLTQLPPLLDEVKEKKLMLSIQSALAIPLQAFTNAIDEQDHLLQVIAAHLIYQASKAQQYVSNIQEDDLKYKLTILSLVTSVIKMGLGAINASELMSISSSLTELASKSFEKIEEKLSVLVSEIQFLLIQTHSWVLQDAESKLLFTTEQSEIELRWVDYRDHIFERANQSIKEILDRCVNNDDFFRCIIKETIYQHEGLTKDKLLLHAVDKARGYVAEIVQGLKAEVHKIRLVKNAVVSPEYDASIAAYFRKIYLINYTLKHQTSDHWIQKWITKKLGHQLSFYFPEVVMQKTWAPRSKKQISCEKGSLIVLGLFQNSSKTKVKLCARLEEEAIHLSDRLVDELHGKVRPQRHGAFLTDVSEEIRGRAGSYSLVQPLQRLFSFSEPSEDMATKPISRSVSPTLGVDLLSYRMGDPALIY